MRLYRMNLKLKWNHNRGVVLTSHLLLEFHTDSVGLLEEDGVAPEQIPEWGELVETPLSERPQRQLSLTLRPRHWRGKWVDVRIKCDQTESRLVCVSNVWKWQYHLPLPAPPPPRGTPGTESSLVSEEPPVYSRSPGRKYMIQNSFSRQMFCFCFQ